MRADRVYCCICHICFNMTILFLSTCAHLTRAYSFNFTLLDGLYFVLHIMLSSLRSSVKTYARKNRARIPLSLELISGEYPPLSLGLNLGLPCRNSVRAIELTFFRCCPPWHKTVPDKFHFLKHIQLQTEWDVELDWPNTNDTDECWLLLTQKCKFNSP